LGSFPLLDHILVVSLIVIWKVCWHATNISQSHPPLVLLLPPCLLPLIFFQSVFVCLEITIEFEFKFEFEFDASAFALPRIISIEGWRFNKLQELSIHLGRCAFILALSPTPPKPKMNVHFQEWLD
jgi:hypothetical protein